MEPNSANASNSDLGKTLFGDDNVFCKICQLWIHGVEEIDKHFLVHSFKNWPTPSQNFNDMLKKKKENAAEYEKGLTETANGTNGSLLLKCLDNKRFGDEFNKYFEGDSTEDSDEKDDDSVVTTVMDFPNNQKILKAEVPCKTGKRNKKNFENSDVPEKKPRFQKIQHHANAYIFNRNKNSKAVGLEEKTEKQKQEKNEPIKLNIKRAGDKLDRYTIIQPRATKIDEKNEVMTAKSCGIQKPKIVSFEDIETQKSSMIKKKSISNESTDKFLTKSNKSSLQTEDGASFSNTSINKPVYITNSSDNIWPVQSYIEKKNASGVPISSEEQEQLLLMFREMQYTKGNEPSRELMNAMRVTYKLRENEVRINAMPIRDSLKIFSGLKNFKLLKQDFATYTQKSIKVLNSKLKDLFEHLIDGEKFKPKVCGRFDVCEKAMTKLKKSPDDTLMKKNVGMLIFGYKQTKGQWQDSLFKCRRKNDDLCIFTVYPFIDIIKEDLWTPNKNMDLYVERQEAGSVSGFYDAIISAYCMYWVFNLEYEDVVRPVFEYFDWIVGNPQSRYK